MPFSKGGPCRGASADAGQRPMPCGVEGWQPSQVAKNNTAPIAQYYYWYNLLYQIDIWGCVCYNGFLKGGLYDGERAEVYESDNRAFVRSL